jgi:hypothetical protein
MENIKHSLRKIICLVYFQYFSAFSADLQTRNYGFASCKMLKCCFNVSFEFEKFQVCMTHALEDSHATTCIISNN